MITTLGKAIAYVAAAHQDQTDKQGVAYILHPVRVADALRRDGYSELIQIIAVLHDVVEDTGITLGDIHRHFGESIRDSVDALTRRKDEQYKEYIIRCCIDASAMKVKKYDVYDNADPRRYCKEAPITRYAWTLEYIKSTNLNSFLIPQR